MRTLWGWVWPIALGCAVAAIIMRWVVSFAIVPSSSMYPTIPNPCYILVDHLATETSSIHEGEVVLFHWPDNPKEIFVKRVIGLPGETVVVRNGHAYIDGKLLNEPYLVQSELGNLVSKTFTVPAGEYFMLGDNRAISDDSRYWKHPFVARSAIIGRADYVIWPFKKSKPIR